MVAREQPVLPDGFASGGLSPRQLYAMLWAYRWWIAAIAGVCVLLAVIVSLLLPKRYEATATLQIDFQVYDPATGREFPAYLAASYMSTQVDIVGSAATLTAAVERLGWAGDPERTAGYVPGSAASLQDWLAFKLGKGLDVGQVKDSRLINISYTSEDPAEAARVANTVAQVYVENQVRQQAGPAQARAKQYSSQLDELRAKVDAAQAKLTEFRQKSGLIDLENRVDVEAQRLLDMNQQLVEAEAQQRAAEVRLQQIGRLRARGEPASAQAEILSSQLIQQLKSQLAAKESQRADLSQTLGRNHPQLRSLDAEIAALRAQLDAETGVYVSSLRNEAEGASQRAAMLRSAVQAQRDKVLETRKLADEAASYQRELQSAEQVYNAALAGYDKLLIGSESDYSNASIVNPATPPVLHSFPKARINVMLGLILGLALGVAVSLLWELRDRRVRCREDLERDLGLTVLGEL